jgi:hypothetical protein
LKNLYYLIFFLNTVFSQEIPQDFFLYLDNKFKLDLGKNWKTYSTLGPSRFLKKKDNLNDSLVIKYRIGIENKNNLTKYNNTSIYGYYHFSYNNNFYGYLYSRIVSNPDFFSRYTGKPRDTSRLGFNSGEVDLSGIGYENDWLILQIGRGRQSWGAMEDLDLVLSEDSPAYDYGLVALNFGQFRGKYFHGFLENFESINRYIVGHGIEYSNQKNLVLSLSEVVIYSGENRTLDMAYLNPFFSHLEIELNKRSNRTNTGSGNAVWMQSIDWFPLSKIRISANFLIDELAIDKIERDNGKGHALASSIRISLSTDILNKNYFILFYQYKKIGSYTFRHQNGTNNFVHRGLPLGSEIGSDGKEFRLGLNYYNQKNFLVESKIANKFLGESSIVINPYAPYIDTNVRPFPSGEVQNISLFSIKSTYWVKPNLAFFSEFEFQKSKSISDRTSFVIGINLFFGYPKKFK